MAYDEKAEGRDGFLEAERTVCEIEAKKLEIAENVLEVARTKDVMVKGFSLLKY